MSNKQNDHFEEAKKESEEEGLQPEDLKGLNQAIIENSERVDFLIDRNFEIAYNKGFYDAKSKYNPNNDFQKIPKEEFEAGSTEHNYSNTDICLVCGKDKWNKNDVREHKKDIISDYAHGFQEGMIAERNSFKLKLEQAITDSVVKGGMVNGDCYLSLDLLNKYLKN